MSAAIAENRSGQNGDFFCRKTYFSAVFFYYSIIDGYLVGFVPKALLSLTMMMYDGGLMLLTLPQYFTFLP